MRQGRYAASHTFKDVMRIFIEGINSHNVTDDWKLYTGNYIVALDYFVEHLFHSLDVDKMAADILQLNSVRELLQLNSTDSSTCLNKTLTYFIQMIGKTISQQEFCI